MCVCACACVRVRERGGERVGERERERGRYMTREIGSIRQSKRLDEHGDRVGHYVHIINGSCRE